jgi:GxxExxY protein
MHENEISSLIIGAAIEVHRYHGPGLVEQVYEESLCHEFNLRHIPFKRQQPVAIHYKGVKLGSVLALDLIVYDKVIVDNKAKDEIHPIDKVKLLIYLRLSNLRLGLLINFHAAVLKDGIFRVVNDLAEYEPPPVGSFRI